jgi:hypothetical protein
MSEYEYEKVENLKAWEIVKLHEEGTNIYTGKFDHLRLGSITNIDALVMAMECGSLYVRKEIPWWEGCEGSVIMIKAEDEWVPAIFHKYSHRSKLFHCDHNLSHEARPLTTAERDAIKVKD